MPYATLGRSVIFGALVLLGGCASRPFDSAASRFKHRIQIETDQSQPTEGDRLMITEVWGTRPRLEVGGTYLVRGSYTLFSLDAANICLYLTALNWDNSGPDVDLQRMTVSNGHGTFALVHSMLGPGRFHVSMSGDRGSENIRVANVYFDADSTKYREQSAAERAP